MVCGVSFALPKTQLPCGAFVRLFALKAKKLQRPFVGQALGQVHGGSQFRFWRLWLRWDVGEDTGERAAGQTSVL